MLNSSKCCTRFIVICVHLLRFSVVCFNVNFRRSYDATIEPFNTQIYKREMSLFFDKASYSFNGFEKIESIPVPFPIDICVLHVEAVRYTAALHRNKNGVRHFAVFKMNNGRHDLLADIATPIASAMDCKEFGGKGYVALAFNRTTPAEDAREGSPIYAIAGDRLRAVQYFPASHMASSYLRVTGNEFFLLQTFANTQASPNLHCPFYKWSGSTFNKWGRIPCSNARHLEPFAIEHENYVAVANYADQRGRTTTYSEVYKYVPEQRKFQLFQKIRTSGAVDVKHFSVPLDVAKRQHFLIFGNSVNAKALTGTQHDSRDLEADSIFYVFDKGQFVPYQRLSLYAVEQFLPIQNTDAEKFLLLVACSNQDTKIYNLNDWKFEESEAQFTEGALGRGVAKMRMFQENEHSYLVIANELMFENETNIFMPIFKQDEHANALRQQIIDWAQANYQRLDQIGVEQLKENVQRKIAQLNGRKRPIVSNDILISNIQTAFTKSLVYPRLHLSSNYWQALVFAKQALDVLEKDLHPRQLEKRAVPKSGEYPARDDRANAAFTADRMNVKTLVIKDSLSARRVNGVDSQKPQFESVTVRKAIVTRSYHEAENSEAQRQLAPEKPDTKPTESEDSSEAGRPEAVDGAGADAGSLDVISVKDLRTTGKLNGHEWDSLMNNTLRRSGLQFLKAAVTIGDLVAETLQVSSDSLNGRDLGKLISIAGGNYEVNQDIQFAAPVNANRLTINDRLNNIHVREQKFDVLLRRSNETQVLRGPKKLDNAKVLEPIILAGHMLGEHLSSMSPNRAVHEDLILTGDYTITADINVSKWLSTTDMIVANATPSIANVLRSGLRLNETWDDVNLVFEQPLSVNDSHVSFVNAHDMQQLVKANTESVQFVAGSKVFNGDLEIRNGSSEVKYLNGLNIEEIEQRLFLKHTNQTIEVPMHLGSIVAKSINGTSLTLNKRELSEYLTRSQDQQIDGSLKVGKLYAQSLNVVNLNTNGHIFDEPLSEIYRQKARSKPHPEIFQKDRKFNGSIYVKNLQTNASLNGRTVEQIERELAELNGNIKYVGNLKFNYDTNISRLTFDGRFNGVPATEIGRSWLQKTGNQNFTVPQTLTTVECEDGILVVGKLNSITTEDLIAKTYWINRNEYVDYAIFENAIEMQDTLQSHTVNGLRIPQDLIFRSSAHPQVLDANVFVSGDLYVKGAILNTSTVNGLTLTAFDRYMNGFGYDTLHVSNANFTHSPRSKTLNGHHLGETLDAVWLANENVDFAQHVEISKASFEGLLEFKGSINNMNLRYLKENYFSLTRAQDIATELLFENTLDLEKDVFVNETIFHGPIFDSKSKVSFNFDEFVANTLKTSGPHEINAIWQINDTTLAGNMLNVNINNLTLTHDVVRMDKPINELTAAKHIMAKATIDALYASPISNINDVCVSNWIEDSVYVYENFTIRGKTIINSVNMYGDLCVSGRINNVSFDFDTLLLRDRNQDIHGDVRIRNAFPEQQRILVNNFERLHTETVNGANVKQFFAQQAKVTSRNEATMVHGDLVFSHPLLVTEFRGGVTDNDRIWKRGSELPATTNGSVENWHRLEVAVQALKQSSADTHYRLHHFEVHQTFRLNACTIIPLTLRTNNTLLDVIAIEAKVKNSTRLQFFRWEAQKQTFLPLDEELSNQPLLKTLLNIHLTTIGNNELLTMSNFNELSDQVAYFNAANTTKVQIANFPCNTEKCFVVNGEEGMIARIYCLQIQGNKLNLKPFYQAHTDNLNVRKILALSNNMIAILYNEAVEIWQTDSQPKATMRIPISRPLHMAVGHRNNTTYLALVSAALEGNSLIHDTIEIYSTTKDSDFVHQQSIPCSGVKEVAFSAVSASDDLLLHVLTSTDNQPLTSFQYKGVIGFKQILGASTLRNVQRFQIIEMNAAQEHLIALIGKDALTFLGIVLRQL